MGSPASLGSRAVWEIKEKMNIEMYSHVMHIVSDVRGKLMKDKNIFDALKIFEG